MKKDLLRIIDANLNRSREGLRVCEEIARFVLEDTKATAAFKDIRHRVSRNIKKIPGVPGSLLKCRNTRSDAGKDILNNSLRRNCKDVFSANIQRTKEALRVLEEFSSVFDRSLGKDFSRLRFKVYNLEKETIARL